MTPIFINSFNRLTCLKRQIERFEEMGLTNLTIIDNASTYQPLLDYLKSLKHEVIYLKENKGCNALWVIDLKIETPFYVYTDPDIIPIPECPNDVVDYLTDILKTNPKVPKAGLGLRIDNLPNTKVADKARRLERWMWTRPLGKELYSAPIDTTFAVYRTGGKIKNQIGIRTGFPYMAEHTTWYEDFDNLDEEMSHYVKVARARWTAYSKHGYYENPD